MKKKFSTLNSYSYPGLGGGTEVSTHPQEYQPPSAVPTQKPQLGLHKLCALWGPQEQGPLAPAPSPQPEMGPRLNLASTHLLDAPATALQSREYRKSPCATASREVRASSLLEVGPLKGAQPPWG